jgi:hypothetical protein
MPMSWDYRVLRKYERAGGKTFVFYEIHEVYYNEHGKVASITEDAVAPYGENISELMIEMSMFLDAFTKPILDFDLIDKKGYEAEIQEYLRPENLSFKNMLESAPDKNDLKNLEVELRREREIAEDVYNEVCVDKPKQTVVDFIEVLRKKWRQV